MQYPLALCWFVQPEMEQVSMFKYTIFAPRDPSFYGATFCVGCGTHLPVGEFLWDGTDEVLGS